VKKNLRILVINPGSTSTAIALFEDDKLLDKETIRHGSEEGEVLKEEERALEYKYNNLILK
jgi:butyrate kinase